jgi:hypothetical protein
VETECDGLMSFDRAVPKVYAQEVRAAISTALGETLRHCRELTL